ncbi:hypothetical protein FHS36_005303 [Streptomyces eurocidicus]|uniref:Uncharacterized protein n=1 Tax=Streptomyces eurocidicus TaxID=66423 RepID=A0A7W8F578_STREU|nr:hypothetical protein [Streptomyces eurocidicus]
MTALTGRPPDRAVCTGLTEAQAKGRRQRLGGRLGG